MTYFVLFISPIVMSLMFCS